MNRASRILKDKKESEILAPKPQIFVNSDGKKFEIYPMPDGKLTQCGDAISQIAEVVAGLAEIRAQGLGGLTLVAFLPQVVKALVPCSTSLIKIALDVDDEYAQSISLVKRLEVIKLILIAEDTATILKNAKELMALFQPEPSTQENPANAPETGDGTESASIEP